MIIVIMVLCAIGVWVSSKLVKGLFEETRSFEEATKRFDKAISFGCARSFFMSLLVGCIIIAIYLLSTFGIEEKIINEKIRICEEENQKIEESIDFALQKYLGYEAETYDRMRSEGVSVDIATAYPELASSQPVARQIEIYINNNGQIKELREDLVDLTWKRWWLYFGK